MTPTVPNKLVLGPKSYTPVTASSPPSHGQCPMSLHYVLFGHGGHLLHRLVYIFEDPPIPLLPQVPCNVNNNPIEAHAFNIETLCLGKTDPMSFLKSWMTNDKPLFFMLHSTHWGCYILCLKILCALILVLKHELVLVLALTSLYGPPLASKLQWGLKLWVQFNKTVFSSKQFRVSFIREFCVNTVPRFMSRTPSF